MATSSRTVQLDLTDRQLQFLRDAMVEEMSRTCKIAREHLREHLGGSKVALADACAWLGVLDELAEVMGQINPPGWRETLSQLKAV